MYKIIINETETEFDLDNFIDREKLLQYVKKRKTNVVPFLNSLLSTFTRIKGYEELPKEEKKRLMEKQLIESIMLEGGDIEPFSDRDFGYSFFDPIKNSFEMRINWTLIDNTPEATIEFLSFLMLHQVCHNYFGHFSRKGIQNYRERNPDLTEVILDAQINSFLIKAFNYDLANDMYSLINKKYIEEKFATMDKLYDLLKEQYNIDPFFDIEKDIPPITAIMDSLDHIYDNVGQEILLEFGLSSMDSHGASNDTQANALSEAGITEGQIDKSMAASMDYLGEVMKSQGVEGSEHTRNLKEAEFKKQTVLESLKLKRTLNKIANLGSKKSYKRVNRRRSYPSDIPMMGKIANSGLQVVIGVDVSGSLSEDELNLIFDNIITFSKKNKNTVEVDLFFWSSGEIIPERDLYKDIKLEEIRDIKPYSYGGTTFGVVNNFINSYYSDKKICFVNITDGYYSKAPMDTNIVETHYGILTANDMIDEYISMHKEDNLVEVLDIRGEK